MKFDNSGLYVYEILGSEKVFFVCVSVCVFIWNQILLLLEHIVRCSYHSIEEKGIKRKNTTE